jgi:hypothetical protein
MKTSKLVLSVLLLLAVSLSCKLLNRSGSKGGLSDGELSKIAANLPIYDPNGPPPSPGAVALRRLAELEPSVANLERDVEAVERAGLKSLLAELRAQENTGNTTEQASYAHEFEESRAVPIIATSSVSSSSLPALFLLQSNAEPGANSAHDAALIGGLVSGLSDIFTGSLTEKGGSVNKSTTETKDGMTTTMSVELGRGEDGSTVFGLGVKTEGSKNGVSVKADVNAKIDGQRCPNAEGQVSFTIKMRLGAQLGGTEYTQELTAFVRAVVNDDAQIASNTIDVIQGTRQVKGGRQVYVETAQTFSNDGSTDSESNYREIRISQQTTKEDQHLSDDGLRAAYSVGRTALGTAENAWLRGACTKIEAKSPGTVSPRSSTAIPVTVRHKFDGSEVPSKLDAALSGGKLVDPTKLARTSGTLTYTAPDEAGKSATIKLTATSRRGRATLDLSASTGGKSYRVAGVSNSVSFTGEICSLDKPFVINATFPGGSAKTSFAPSGAAGGATTVSGGGGGCVHSGGGTYTVTTNADGSATLTWTTTDKLVCPGFSNNRTATFTLPLQPAPEILCP